MHSRAYYIVHTHILELKETLNLLQESCTVYVYIQLAYDQFPVIYIPPPQTNTFQAVLASDGSASYCFFLYDTLQWTNTDTDNITATELLPQVATNTLRVYTTCTCITYRFDHGKHALYISYLLRLRKLRDFNEPEGLRVIVSQAHSLQKHNPIGYQ